MKKFLTMMVCALSVGAQSYARPYFNKTKDILVAQFDSKPDPDDIHAQAALGCMLAHKSMSGVNYFAVAGAYGTQRGNSYIDSKSLFNMAFGAKNVKWTDAHNDWNGSVTRIKNKLKPILNNGGKVWVQEAGQSNITADWIRALINDGVAQNVIKNNVIVVQHSGWNEDNTASADFSYVKSKANYQAIDNGNVGSGNGENRGPNTPQYNTKDKSFMNRAKSSRNPKAKALWTEADKICDNQSYHPDWSAITHGGVDYSDCVENWWIFNVANAGTVSAFWATFVTNIPASGGDTDEPADSFVGKTVALKANGNGKYVCADKGRDAANCTLLANRTAVGGWEKFQVVDAGNGLVALKANVNSKFVVANSSLSNKLTATAGSITANAKFSFDKNSDGTYFIKVNSTGKYVRTDKTLDETNWPVAGNLSSSNPGGWALFRIEIK